MGKTLAGVYIYTHGNFREIKKVGKNYLYKAYKKTDQLII